MLDDCQPGPAFCPESKQLFYNGNLVAGGLGFEPRLTESESAVLPLNYPPTLATSVGRGAGQASGPPVPGLTADPGRPRQGFARGRPPNGPIYRLGIAFRTGNRVP